MKRYVLVHRSWWHRANGYIVNSLRVFDMTEGKCLTSPRWTGTVTLGTIYAHAEQVIGRAIETDEAFVDSVQVGTLAKLHNA